MNVTLEFTEKDHLRFSKKVNREIGDNSCHWWVGSTSKKGYGYFHYRGRTLKAYRVMYELVNGPIPTGLHVLHRCDNPSCVNHEHLFLGTNEDNHKDKIVKNRQYRPPRKFTSEEIQYIRDYPRYWGSLSDLAREFNCATSTMYYTRENKPCR